MVLLLQLTIQQYEAADIAGTEQLFIGLRFFVTREESLCFVSLDDIDAETNAGMIVEQ
ncbi:hypothetical protein DPMN_000754 [Dreissena polymorpha]|uniref:Uncharacterized protein n=1 Tax=Dreissena polymorpha TaxID=45954 RepID=A0A9D4RSF1_DREPO|nr:hypothetical protein DPMN_000754 [Dreissena polymorpha]